MEMKKTTVDHIPVVWCEPAGEQPHDIVIWLPGFSGTKESVAPKLERLAEEGFIAISFDPYQHGERRADTQEELVKRIRGNIRKFFWPILALTAEEYPRIIDWALQLPNNSGIVKAGGVSMGGDISVAAAGIDERIRAVAACIATPDWLRPGTCEPPGEADRYAQMCYDRCNPLTHPERYAHRPAISFQCGEQDIQVPPDGADRFVAALHSSAYKGLEQRLEVVKQPQIPHKFTDAMWDNCIKWFHAY